MEYRPSLTVSVIIPVHSGADVEQVSACLNSLLQSASVTHEIVVVTDGPVPRVARIAETHGVSVITLPDQGGPARARNRGAEQAQGDILLFVDGDVLVPDDVIPNIVEVFQTEPTLGVLFGSYDDAPSAENFLSQYRNLMHHYIHQQGNERASTFWAGCGAIRRDLFWAYGGFDEDYREASIEDIELGYRLTADGHRIRLLQSLQVKHQKRWDVFSLLHTDFFRRALPWTRLILRDRRLINDLNVDNGSRLSVALLFVLMIMVSATAVWPWVALLSIPLALSLFAINWPFYQFFWQKRGLSFALQVIPWHWLYFFYIGIAFILGNLQHFGQMLTVPVPSIRLQYRNVLGEERTQ